MKRVAESADKPGSVWDSHSSRRTVTRTLKQPTRRHRGPRHRLPIWPCSRWGLPYRPVARLAVRSYRTISPLPAELLRHRRYLSVALSVGLRRPGVTWHRALWSPDFPRHLAMTRLSGRLRHGYSTASPSNTPALAPRTPISAFVHQVADLPQIASRLLEALQASDRPGGRLNRPACRPARHPSPPAGHRSRRRRRTCRRRTSRHRRAGPACPARRS